MSSPLQWTAVPSALDYFTTLVADDESLNLAEAAKTCGVQVICT